MVTRWVLWTTLELQSHPAPSAGGGGMPHEWCVRRSSSSSSCPKKCALIRLMAHILSSAGLNHVAWRWCWHKLKLIKQTQLPLLFRTSSSSCLLSITLALVATQMQTVFVCCVCLLDKLLSATFDSWLCTRELCVWGGGRNVKNNRNSVNIILVCWPLVTAAWPQYAKYAYNGILVRCAAGLRIIKP